MFERCSSVDFHEAIGAHSSEAFRAKLETFCDFSQFIDQDGAIAFAHCKAEGGFKPPASCTMIVGDLTVEGVVDVGPGTDEPGLFIVLGNVTCRSLLGGDNVIILVDGHLEAKEAIVNGFEHASLSVMRTLRTKLFVGEDIWAEVGDGAVMEYGCGYCLPLGYGDAQHQAIGPIKGKAETLAIVSVPPRPTGYFLSSDAFAEAIRASEAIFK